MCPRCEMFCPTTFLVQMNYLFYSCRSDTKDLREDVNENQQSPYSQCNYTAHLHLFPICLISLQSAKLHCVCVNLCLSCFVGPVGGWFIPGTGSLCPPVSPHSQFGNPISLSQTYGCERYSTLRNHRSAPYNSPYAPRTNSPSECPPPLFTSKHYTTSSQAIYKKLKQMLLSIEWFAFQ